MTLPELLSSIEVTLRRRAEQEDLLMLLAQVASALGADMDDYELPGARVREWLDEEAGPARDPELRRLQIVAAVEAGVGELG